MLLGLGPDGHTASLFPGTEVLEERQRRAAAVWVEKFSSWRVTLTYPLIERAGAVWFFVSGDGKAAIVQEVLEGPPGRYPAQRITAAEELAWYLDRAAAGRLSPIPA